MTATSVNPANAIPFDAIVSQAVPLWEALELAPNSIAEAQRVELVYTRIGGSENWSDAVGCPIDLLWQSLLECGWSQIPRVEIGDLFVRLNPESGLETFIIRREP